MSEMSGGYRRPQAASLAARLAEPRRLIHVVAGPRQVGKTTLVQQVVESLGLPAVFASADEPTLRGPEWVGQQWDAARLRLGAGGALLVLDEIQQAPGWAEAAAIEDTLRGRICGLEVPGMHSPEEPA